MALYDDAALALTELVANAVMHAVTPLVVTVSCERGMVEIGVHDGNPSMPAIRPPHLARPATSESAPSKCPCSRSLGRGGGPSATARATG